jgi:succinate dehydrogenase/fumarate reductase flavoprotein subunit
MLRIGVGGRLVAEKAGPRGGTTITRKGRRAMPETNHEAEVVARRKVQRTRVMRDAEERGYWLTHRPLDNGEYAWSWLLHDDDRSQPSFPTRREAFRFMREKLNEPDS